jgi:hypothetical protein
MALLPIEAATLMVVPAPRKGSRTTPRSRTASCPQSVHPTVISARLAFPHGHCPTCCQNSTASAYDIETRRLTRDSLNDRSGKRCIARFSPPTKPSCPVRGLAARAADTIEHPPVGPTSYSSLLLSPLTVSGHVGPAPL